MASPTVHLFCFGYQTAAQFSSGSEDENSQGVLIEATSEADAMVWGREVAEAYVARVFPGVPSWKQSMFAHWIETDEAIVTACMNDGTPRCGVGEQPAWPEHVERERTKPSRGKEKPFASISDAIRKISRGTR
ncbi:MAG: hypothetical protein AB7P03_07795 [Kofleriaceae bacterium]